MHSIPSKTCNALTHRAPSLACAMLLLGCSEVLGSGRLELTVANGDAAVPLVIATGCEPVCKPSELTVSITYPGNELRAPNESIELLQYRIDYGLDAAVGAVPYYAGQLSVPLKPGDMTTLTLPVAGSAQRTFVTQTLGTRTADGQATISFAGYDWNNGQVITSNPFSVRFESTRASSQVGHGGTND